MLSLVSATLARRHFARAHTCRRAPGGIVSVEHDMSGIGSRLSVRVFARVFRSSLPDALAWKLALWCFDEIAAGGIRLS
jgi:hypothetical protein